MPRSLKSLLAVCLLFAASPLSAWTAQPPAETLFVFSADTTAAQVYDAATLDWLGAPQVGRGAFRAIAVADRFDPARASKFYVVGARSVAVLSGDLEPQGVIDLPLPALSDPQAVVLSADGSRLVIASSLAVYLIDTASDEIVALLESGFSVAGVARISDPDRIYVVASGAALLRTIDLRSDSLSDEVTMIPAPLTAWGVSADGAHALGYGDGGVYDLNRIGGVVFSGRPETVARYRAGDADPLRASFPGAQGSNRPPAGRMFVSGPLRYLLVNGDVAAEGPSGPAFLGRGSPAAPPRLWAVSSMGDRVFVAPLGERTVQQVGVSQAAVTSVALEAEPGAIDLAAPQAQASGSLSVVTANNKPAAGGTAFNIVVEALDGSGTPQPDVVVFAASILPADPMLECFSAMTNAAGQATLPCRIAAVAGPTDYQLVFFDSTGRRASAFTVKADVPLDFEGSRKGEGDGQIVGENFDFSITGLIAANGIPAIGSQFVSEVEPTAAADCPRTATVDESGVATLVCHSNKVGVRTKITITLRGPDLKTFDYKITIDPNRKPSQGLEKVSGDGQTVLQGAPFTLVVQYVVDGKPVVGANLNVVTSILVPPKPANCPLVVTTDAQGFGRINCQSGSVFFDQIVQIYVNHFQVVLPSPFTVRVTNQPQNVTPGLEPLSPLEFSLIRNLPTEAAIELLVTSSNNSEPLAGRTVYLGSKDQVLIEPLSPVSDSSGIARATITLGCDEDLAEITAGLTPGAESIKFSVTPAEGMLTALNVVQGDMQIGLPGQLLDQVALVAEARDTCGDTIREIPVTWQVYPPYAATLVNASQRTVARGRVSALARLGNYGGPFQVEVRSLQSSARFHLSVLSAGDSLMAKAGNAQSVASGQTAPDPLIVQAFGANGFGLAGEPVVWSVAEGPGTILSSSTITNGAGLAFATVKVNAVQAANQGPNTPLVKIDASALGSSVSFFINDDGRPVAPVGAFVNGASFQPGWVPGAAATIFGQRLSNVNGVLAADQVPFPTDLGGVSVSINGVPAPIIAIVNVNGQEQINLQTPFETGVGPATVLIDNNGSQSTIEGVPVNSVQPGIFEIFIEGQRIAAALHQDSTLITPSSPAVPGEVVQLFYSGGGPLSIPVGTNQPGPVPLAFTTGNIVVAVDGTEQQNFGSVYAPGLITANQTNFELAPGTFAGSRNLTVSMDGVVSQTAFLPVGIAAAAAVEQ